MGGSTKGNIPLELASEQVHDQLALFVVLNLQWIWQYLITVIADAWVYAHFTDVTLCSTR